MINSIRIKDSYKPQGRFSFLNDCSRNGQVRNLYCDLENGIEFKPGINILIGENGSGKSTILNILKSANLLHHSFIPEMDKLPITTFEELKTLFENFEIKEDYRFPVFNLYRMCEDKEKICSNDLETIMEATQYISIGEESKGQNLLGDINTLWYWMFEKTEECYPMMYYLNKYKDEVFGGYFNTEEWAAKDVIKMITDNQELGFDYTVLMDEPDAGLDIENLGEIYQILSKRKEQTQLIVSVHNPILIHKLSKVKDINIIELSEGYLNKIKEFVEVTE